MNKSSFIELINAPSFVSDKHLKSLEEMVENFPYCQLGHQFIAKGHHDEQHSLSWDKLKMAAIHSTSRKTLRKLLDSRNIKPADPGIHSERSKSISLEKKKTEETNIFVENEEKTTPVTIESPIPPVVTTPVKKEPILPTVQTPSAENKTGDDGLSPWMRWKLQEEAREKEAMENTTVAIPKDKPEEPLVSTTSISDDSIQKEIEYQHIKTDYEDLDSQHNQPLPKDIIAPSQLAQIKSDLETISGFKKVKQRKKEQEEIQNTETPDNGNQLTDHTEEIHPIIHPDLTGSSSAIDFEKKSNFDYLSEFSNINLKNLIPEKKIIPVESFEEPVTSLIPEALGLLFGLYDSKFGEALYSEDQLKASHNEELVAPVPKSIIIVDEKEIIDDFLKKNPKIKSVKDLSPEDEIEDLSKARSTKFGRPVTETMANIYLSQGNTKKAKSIFEKLILLFPEKKAYFAKKLREINE